MIQQDYNISISANVTSQEAFDGICRVSEWWATDFKGNSQKPDDIFTVDFSGTWVTFKVVEFIPNQIIVWLVTDCYLAWINDKKEWLGTRLNWEITTENNTTQISFTHIGLVPGIECYNDCKEGWGFHIGKSLLQLLTEKKGIPNVNTREREN